MKPFTRRVATGEEESRDKATAETNEEYPVYREALYVREVETAKGSIRTLASERGVCTRTARKVARMASTGREILGEHYNDEHLTHEEIRGLGLKVVTEKGETVPNDELQGKIFRIVDKDDASGYVVSSMETTGTATVLCYLQAS